MTLLKSVSGLAIACVVALVSSNSAARSQSFSDRPIRMIVAVAPGGATDVTARIIANKLSDSLKTSVIVENKPGGFFEPAYREIVNAAPDGHTLFMISAAIVVAQPSRKDYPFDVRKMTAVSEVSSGPFILTARKTLNIKSVAELEDAIKRYIADQSRRAKPFTCFTCPKPPTKSSRSSQPLTCTRQLRC